MQIDIKDLSNTSVIHIHLCFYINYITSYSLNFTWSVSLQYLEHGNVDRNIFILMYSEIKDLTTQ